MNDASAKDPQTSDIAGAETPEALRRREALRKMAQLAGVGGTTAAVLLTSRRSRAGS